MSKADEALVLELKNVKNTNIVPLTKYNISDESWTKRGSIRINSTISNHDDHPNFVSILEDDNLIPIPEKTSFKSHRAKPGKKSKVRKDYELEVKHEAPSRKIKLSIKIDGKILVWRWGETQVRYGYREEKIRDNLCCIPKKMKEKNAKYGSKIRNYEYDREVKN